jgi:hypothetical protein
VSWKATRISFAAVVLATSQALAAWGTHAPQSAFVFRGRPIDPVCVTALNDGRDAMRIPLAGCTKSGRISRDGRVFGTPSDSYEVLARNGARFVVSVRWSGGGARRFLDLMVVKKRDDVLSVDATLYAGDDRCKGDIFDADVHGHVVRWSQNIMPYDAIAVAEMREGYKYLESLASRCMATSNMEYDLDRNAKRLVSVTLTGPLRRAGEQDAGQPCSASYFDAHVPKGRAGLDTKALKPFIEGFLRACPAP